MAFPEKVDKRKTLGPGTMINFEADRRWDTSDRVAGELILTPQRCQLSTMSETIQSLGATPRLPPSNTLIGSGLSGSDRYRGNIIHGGSTSSAPWPALATRARARFLGKWEVPAASLGVTLATWRQSARMLHSNGNRMLKAVDVLEMQLKRVKLSRNRKLKKDLDKIRPGLVADLYLEFIFGWIPLFEDFKAISYALCKQDHLEQYLRGTAKETLTKAFYESAPTSQYGGTWSYNSTSTCRVTVAGAVGVNNPNHWLLQRLGLLNLPGVAVDLIPWSFVTGMFWNQAAFVGQLTDTIGLDLSKTSTTYSLRGTLAAGAIPNGASNAYYKGGYRSTGTHTQKVRYVGTIPSASAVLKDFKLDFGKAAIFFSLAAQKLARLPVRPWNPRL